MAKLQVLADGLQQNATQRKKIFRRNRCSCGHDALNKNANNININFGTNVENSHNETSGGGRAIGYDVLPRMDNIYAYQMPRIPIKLPPPVILKQDKNANYEVIGSENIAREIRKRR